MISESVKSGNAPQLVEITDEMIDAGAAVLAASGVASYEWQDWVWRELAHDTFRAMTKCQGLRAPRTRS